MPNWCMTQVTINSRPEEISALKKVITEIQESTAIKTDFGPTWLGLYLHHLGEWDEENGTGSCPCRGSAQVVCEDEESITIDVESAWSPQLGAISKLCAKYAPQAEIVFTAVEPSCLIYTTNDPSHIGDYLLDIWDDSNLPDAFEGMCYEFLDEIHLRDTLIDALDGCEQLTTTSLIEKAEDVFSDKLSINQFQYQDLEEVCV